MLRLVARGGEATAGVLPLLDETHFRHPANRKLYEALRAASFDAAALAGGADEKLAAAAAALSVEPIEGDLTPGYVHAVWARLQGFVLKAHSDSMRAELQKLNPTTDTEAYDELFRRLVEVDGELRRLREEQGSATSPVRYP
jgi:DNA primase